MKKIPYEDVQFVANCINQCASNVITVSRQLNDPKDLRFHLSLIKAINAPLQNRSYVRDVDFKKDNEIPGDFNTDLEFEWAKERMSIAFFLNR